MVRRLYSGIDGFGAVGAGPGGRALQPARSHTYGELTSVGTRQLIAATGLCATDLFVDLGAGVGKVALGVALRVPGIRCIGIEISGARHAGACQALHRAEALGWLEPGRCTFRHADALNADLSGATILFANSTCFPEKLLGSIARKVAALDGPLTFVTLQRLPAGPDRMFEHVATRVCQTSWTKRCDMHLYRRPAQDGR